MRMEQTPKRKTYKELYSELAPISFCATRIIGNLKNPDLVHIQFKGPIANIPALKNQKVKGTNILRDNAKVIFDLMTRSFQRSVNFNIPQFDKKTKVFCVIFCAARRNSFDEDNVLTSIKDWLEPSYIRKKNRGWGVGVVENDSMINAYAIKKQKNAKDCELTEIYLRKYSDIKNDLDKFLLQIIS